MRALVTGGNRGLGLECVKVLLEAGCDLVFMGCRDEAAGRLLACSLADTYGDRVLALQLDVTSPRSLAAAADVVRATNAPRDDGHNDIPQSFVDILVNNAGVLLESHEDGQKDVAARRTLAVNVYGAIDATEAFLPLLGPQARVLNVSSSVGTRTHGRLTEEDRAAIEAPDVDEAALRSLAAAMVARVEDATHPYCRMPTPAYGLSKCLLNAYTRLLARKRPDLRVNACSPGFCHTGMSGPLRAGGRVPKSAALGATVFKHVLFTDLGADKTDTFFKQASAPGTPLDDATSKVDPWVTEPPGPLG